MSVRYLPDGTFGVDYSSARPTVADLRSINAEFAIRYICAGTNLDGVRFGTTSTTIFHKIATKSELLRLSEGGIGTMLHYEQDVTMTLGGAPAGTRHGRVAAQWIEYFNYPRMLTMVFSTDVGVTAAQRPIVADFLYAAKDELAKVGVTSVGSYNGSFLNDYLKSLGLCDIDWVSGPATSWSPNGIGDVDILQGGYRLGTSCDADWLHHPVPFWYPSEPDSPLPPQEEGMYTLFTCVDADAVFYGYLDSRGFGHIVEHLPPDEVALYRKLETPEKPMSVTNGDFRHLVLAGVLPILDSRYTWAESDFRRVIRDGASVLVPHTHDVLGTAAVVGSTGPARWAA